LALASLLTAFCLWQLTHLGGFQWGVDEGMYLMRVFLMQKGYRLYTDIWTDQLPGLIALIHLSFAIFGNSVAVGRAVIVLLATLGLLGTALLAYRLGGSVGSLISTVMLALAPNFFWLSRAIISPDLPSISLATLSLAFMFNWLHTHRRWWLLLSGAIFALGFLVKATSTLVLIPLSLVVLLVHWRGKRVLNWRETAEDWGLFALSIALPILIGLSFYEWQAMYDQVVGTQLRSSQVYDPKVVPHARKIWQYLITDNYGLLALGLYGIIPGMRKRWKETLIILAWLFVTLVALLIRSPMWPQHHLVVLLFPLAILAGIAVQQIWDHLRQISTNLPIYQSTSLPIYLIALGIYLASLPRIVKADRELLAAPSYRSQELGVQFIQEATAADEFVITDYPIIPFRAGRRVPPSLCTVSAKRIKIGLLTDEELISAAEEYKPKAIVSWIDRLPRLPAFMDWMRERYYLAWSYGTDHRIYLLFDPSSIQNPQTANLAHKVKLLGYTIDNWAVEAGDALHLTLYWQTQQRMERIYKVFTHLLDKEENMWGQKDEIAWGWFHPTTDWLPGEVIVLEFEIPVSADAPPGEYAIEIGMYDRETQERLPVFDEAGNRLGDRILLNKKPAVRWEGNFAIPANIQHPMQSNLADKVSFLGYDLLENKIKPGDALQLTLYWQAQSRMMSTNYKVFTHLIDEDKHIWGQQDSVPGQGRYPTTGWLEGEVIVDEYEIPVEPDAPPGEYILEIGMYDALTLQRLPAFDRKGERLSEDRILLEKVIIEGH
jgi:4-amino-4-deoxy-L-arabinose transferase-like glycosyltransferase